jgi:type III secretion system PrgH/EprH family protein
MNDQYNEDDCYIVRFENTLLAGYEYQLCSGATRLFVGNSNDISEHQASTEESSILYIPDEKLSVELELIPGITRGTISKQQADGSPSNAVSIPYNEVVDFEGVKFAFKRSKDIWKRSKETVDSRSNDRSHVKRNKLYIVMFCVLLAVGTVLAFNYFIQGIDKKETEISDLIGGDDTKFKVFTGADGRVYILSENSLNKSWSIQSLIKQGKVSSATVLTEREEAKKIIRTFDNTFPGLRIHVFRFDEPSRPHIVLSRERSFAISASEIEKLNEKLRKKFPYITEVSFSYFSDKDVEKYAEEGIKRITSHYQKKQHKGQGITLYISGSRDDIEINALKEFIINFNRTWQTDYVNFVVELEDNWFKDKSYLYGQRGFVKMSSSHWLFPESK